MRLILVLALMAAIGAAEDPPEIAALIKASQAAEERLVLAKKEWVKLHVDLTPIPRAPQAADPRASETRAAEKLAGANQRLNEIRAALELGERIDADIAAGKRPARESWKSYNLAYQTARDNRDLLAEAGRLKVKP